MSSYAYEKDPLYDCDNYCMGVIMEADEKELIGCYGVTNKNTGVCEFANPKFAVVLSSMLALNAEYEQALAQYEEAEGPRLEFNH